MKEAVTSAHVIIIACPEMTKMARSEGFHMLGHYGMCSTDFSADFAIYIYIFL